MITFPDTKQYIKVKSEKKHGRYYANLMPSYAVYLSVLKRYFNIIRRGNKIEHIIYQ